MRAKHKPAAARRESLPRTGRVGRTGVALLLPGMTLNAGIFPALPLPTITTEFNDLRLGVDGGGRAVSRARMDLYARMLHDRLRREPLWQGRRIVVAHSFGGMLALRWLLRFQGDPTARIDGLVLVGTTAGPMFARARLRLGALAGRDVRLPIAPLVGAWNTPWVTRTVKRILSDGLLEAEPVDFRSLPDQSDLALDLAGWRNTDWRAMRSYRIAMAGFDVRQDLPRIAVQVIVLHGTADSLFPVDAARDLVRRLPQAELRLVEGAGHGLPLTHGERVREAVEELAAR
jgi:pimeloyl-ACP methyl ester carboxylesterase